MAEVGNVMLYLVKALNILKVCTGLDQRSICSCMLLILTLGS